MMKFDPLGVVIVMTPNGEYRPSAFELSAFNECYGHEGRARFEAELVNYADAQVNERMAQG